ncbi:hypothetical protein DFA_01951 [Cavenderia fasciculata]|uniref:Uncharacterized protein n=1 Tax=Cavenderia fasciculata TaxID=261658 RepID=F4PR04_CACFS|nr:uncharacterized protein DFA_01951 [Cavenderia fasciculata]EGG22061.1 hypothetical protein DFA_01951 [Cavenderia fasciculata]|eukprot:XP_004359912.1 hypothetical protein DFA_01951 [Cavenderia fasciculata]
MFKNIIKLIIVAIVLCFMVMSPIAQATTDVQSPSCKKCFTDFSAAVCAEDANGKADIGCRIQNLARIGECLKKNACAGKP